MAAGFEEQTSPRAGAGRPRLRVRVPATYKRTNRTGRFSIRTLYTNIFSFGSSRAIRAPTDLPRRSTSTREVSREGGGSCKD